MTFELRFAMRGIDYECAVTGLENDLDMQQAMEQLEAHDDVVEVFVEDTWDHE